MRFMGENGWPSPQLREIELKKGSWKWSALYCQTMMSIRRLYHCARLVHGDLSEFNIMICPMSQVENAMDKSKESENSLQVVIIDFGQAVDCNHPSALKLLQRDVFMVQAFFKKQGIVTLKDDEAEQFIVRKVRELVDHCNNAYSVKSDAVYEPTKPSPEDVNSEYSDEMSEIRTNRRYEVKGWDDQKDLNWLEMKLEEVR